MTTDPWAGFRAPVGARFEIWLLRRGAFSKLFFFLLVGIALRLIKGDQMEFSFRLRTISWSALPDLKAIGVNLAMVAVLAFIGLVISARETRALQNVRDRQGAKVLNAVLSQDPPRYYLYLRPFFLTRRMNLSNPKHGTLPMQVSYYSETKTTDLETMLERAVHQSGFLVALGQPGEMIGAGRIAVAKEEWKGRFESLARAAACIFVIPSHTTGTKWEVEWLRENAFLAKCVFIMPPRIKEKIVWRKRKLVKITVDMKTLWNKAASVLAESGLFLPAYSEAGLVFTLSDAGVVRTSAGIGDTARLRANMVKIGASL
jgi:hypothetical protein